MKTKLLLSVITLLSIRLYASPAPALKCGPLVAALIQVESRGNDYAIGDRAKGEHAYGALQIRKPCIDDVNRRCGTHYKAEQCLGNRTLSVWVCQEYIRAYASSKWLGHDPTLEDEARIWNGGPAGWRRSATLGYWAKVRKAMERNGMMAVIK